MGGERPDQLVLRAEVGRYLHAKHEPIAAREEMRRLPLIGGANVEAVLGADRYVDLFFPVPVHVTEQEVFRPVSRLLPPFVRGRDVLAFRVRE
jgi:hypothetical protein